MTCGKSWTGDNALIKKIAHENSREHKEKVTAEHNRKKKNDKRKQWATKDVIGDRATAMMLLAFTGSVEQTAMIMGRAASQIRTWQSRIELDDTDAAAIRDALPALTGNLETWLNQMLWLLMARGYQAEYKDVAASVHAMMDKLVALRKLDKRLDSEPEPDPAPTPVKAKPAVQDLPPVNDETAKWNGIVDKIMQNPSNTLSRDEIIDNLITRRPEAKPYLRPEQPTQEGTDSVN